jgi:glycosyltransferase involved in cell wall biosynthesis
VSSAVGNWRANCPSRPPPAPRGALAGESLRLSVVVPTCGRPELLRRCLQALMAQSLPGRAFEILVVDDGHDDTTRRLVDSLADEAEAPRLRYLRSEQPRGGPAAARNLGWRSAHGEVVAFTDDDTVPLDDWLAQGEAAMQSGHWAALGGRVRVPLDSEPPTDHARMTQGLERARCGQAPRRALGTPPARVWA